MLIQYKYRVTNQILNIGNGEVWINYDSALSTDIRRYWMIIIVIRIILNDRKRQLVNCI